MKESLRIKILTAVFAALTAVGAFLRIPTPWSSFTLQVLFVLLAGIFLGPKWGSISQLIYMLLGLAGLPIFTSGGGPGSIMTPTFGFVIGFIPAALVTGLICRNSDSPLNTALGCIAGDLAIYLVGIPYMALILNGSKGLGMSFSELLWAGMIPFIPYDLAKIAIAVAVTIPLKKALRAQGLLPQQ